MRALLVVALVACGGKKEPPAPAPAPPRDAAAVVDAAEVTDWKPRCKAALIAAAAAPSGRRPREIIDGCRPCGDWTPLLRWDIRSDDGGPPRVAIEDAMERCDAYCSTAAKQRFLGTLDDARGKRVRTPWRALGELCGEAVSARPDARFVSAPYFALDRIARAAALDPELAKLMAAVELPLPPVGATGDGMTLPLAPVTKPDTGRVQVTVAANGMQHVGLFARARLTGSGVHVEGDYPGALIPTKRLAATLDERAPTEPVITIVAPMGLPARRIAEVVVGKRPFVLAAELRAAPHGWSLLGHVPVELVTGGQASLVLEVSDAKSIDTAIERFKTAPSQPIAVAIADGAATVNDLAKLLGAFAYRGVTRVSITTRR